MLRRFSTAPVAPVALVALLPWIAALAPVLSACGRTEVDEVICPDGRDPAPEICDGVDNDCDFQIDETDPTLGLPCDTGLSGVCEGGGVVTCESGTLSCLATIEPTPESCDGLDNDCDGTTDEEDPGGGADCGTGTPGVCGPGRTRCDSPDLVCVPLANPSPELCDNLDNDCDGDVDEGNPGGGSDCFSGQPGVCADGTLTCSGGLLICVPDLTPSIEVCDGLDNDCDGTVDDGNPGGGMACSTGLPGLCGVGATACVGGGVTCQQTTFPAFELCDGLDNDCDGPVDEGDPGGGGACLTGMPGVCGPGTEHCVAGGILCESDTTASPEVCDGVDNDCDGPVDEGNPGGGALCDTGDPGVCGPGTITCVVGALACVANVGASPELCDGADNDCDGPVDENNPGGGLVCDTGLLGVCAAGTTDCQAGALACLQDIPSSPEVCDLADNDCDGAVDDGNPGGGAVCDTGIPGPCGPGLETCVTGAIECVSTVPPEPEMCDGVDNDCDGFPDNGDPGGGVDCDTGLLGVCADGATACVGAMLECQQLVSSMPEICNGLDDDCDGPVDEDTAGTNLPCSTGLGGTCDPGITVCDASGTIICEPINAVPEVCDNQDNDCDTAVDEGLPLFECNTCDPDCHRLTLTGPFPLPGDPNLIVEIDGVSFDPMGNLILDSTSIEGHFAWIANFMEGSVSKLDTDTGFEVARYDSVLLADTPTARPPQEVCDWTNLGNCPSRTAVDLDGDVWVTNRAFGSQGTVAKIANLETDCVDRNGNGVIDTSRDENGDGVIDPDCDGNGVFDSLATVCPAGNPPEYMGQDDECILFGLNVGPVDSVPRSVSIDLSGAVWVGAYNDEAFYKLDGQTGTLLARVPPTGSAGISPYGSVIDSSGTLWAVNGCCANGGLRSIDTVTHNIGPIEVKPFSLGAGLCDGGGPGQYGIAIDGDDRIWVAGWPCNAAFVYDPSLDTWAVVNAMNPGYGGRGISVDGFGQVWMAMHDAAFGGARLARMDAASLSWVETLDLTAPPLSANLPVGVGVDFNGSIWTVNQSSSSAVRVHIDPLTGAPSPHPDTGNILDEFPVGLEPYTYSDFTGFILRTFTAPSGTYSFVVDGCLGAAPATWDAITWNATTPPGTAVEISVKAGDDLATLDSEPTLGDWTVSPANLAFPPGPVPDSVFLKVTVRLVSLDEMANPTVANVQVQWSCAPGT